MCVCGGGGVRDFLEKKRKEREPDYATPNQYWYVISKKRAGICFLEIMNRGKLLVSVAQGVCVWGGGGCGCVCKRGGGLY